MDLNINDKVALLLGGAGTMGMVIARAMSDEGCTAVVSDLPASCERVTEWPTSPVDVTDEQSVQTAVSEVHKRFGKIDILVTLVGVYQACPITELSADDWDRLMRINLKGTFLACREVLPLMRESSFGRIICVASLAGQVGGLVAGAHYSASKAGVLSLVKSLARQAGCPSITVNAINPGPTEGTMTGGWPKEDRQRMIDSIPVGRFAQPEEIADIVLLLSSPRTGYIHGAHIDINGGAYLD